MDSLQMANYVTPWRESQEPLATTPIVSLLTYSFTVTDAATGVPIAGALCVLYSSTGGTGEGAGEYTNSQGKVSITPEWFSPRSWGVTKAGYISQGADGVPFDIVVALRSTTVMYTVRVNAGVGGNTTPRGTITRAPGTELTVTAIPDSGYEFSHWLKNGQTVESRNNPLGFLINQDNISINAIFSEEVPPTDNFIETYRGIDIWREAATSKLYFTYQGSRYVFPVNTSIGTVRRSIDELLEEAPPNGEPPNGEVWPIVKTEQVFDNTRLAPGIMPETLKHKTKNVDTSIVLGGQISYTVELVSSILTGCTFGIAWNGQILEERGFLITDPYGKVKTGVVDIPLGWIQPNNVLTIGLSHVPAMMNVVVANVSVTLGYSSEPDEDPPWGTDWKEWLRKNWKWIALGVTGLTVLIVMRPGRQPIIVIPGGGK